MKEPKVPKEEKRLDDLIDERFSARSRKDHAFIEESQKLWDKTLNAYIAHLYKKHTPEKQDRVKFERLVKNTARIEDLDDTFAD